ncbi:PEP-CTERM sorting domain-containing protein [Noviherbaspirillum sedimenti]|uniref:PEP-CTERM sorting domain-containing protein n=1 Tax=Noviherbaspirillum sedimenti TaxID=2320865 RepID=A0A3A3G403_9BURK|nr:PEP-CTERM sorting domain-containing protein [Noviherbaspirillum sedimenti]RJG01222.1 PEP-CTERM sorting domain-containing protein [Noviherbaspirillum sedimenti]
MAQKLHSINYFAEIMECAMFSLRNLTVALCLTVGALIQPVANAAPVDVSYSVTGNAGNWVLDFSVTNNLGGANNLYFFGVDLPTRDIVNTPTGWDQNVWTSWNNSTYGGSTNTYNNVWIRSLSTGFISNGQTWSGFQVHLADLELPSSIDWFAFAFGGTYTGSGYFNNANNPGFEGTIVVSQTASNDVPEPETISLLALGLLAATLAQRKKS